MNFLNDGYIGAICMAIIFGLVIIGLPYFLEKVLEPRLKKVKA